MRKLSGFTIIEVMVVLFLMGIIAAATLPNLAEEFNEKRTDVTSAEVWMIAQAAQKYAADNSGDWPDDTNNCSDAITALTPDYLQNVDSSSPWDTTYLTDCTGSTFSVEVQTDSDWAGVMANSLPAASVNGAGDTTTVAVPLPASVPALAGLLHRNYDSSNPEHNQMNTDINMTSESGDPQDINDAQDVEASTFTDRDNNNFKVDPDGTSVMKDVRADRLIDRNNGTFKVDPNQTSRMRNLETRRNSWGLVTKDASGNNYANPRNSRASIHVNDVYLRSAGAYVSDLFTRRKLIPMGMYRANMGDYIRKPNCSASARGGNTNGTPLIKVTPAAVKFGSDSWYKSYDQIITMARHRGNYWRIYVGSTFDTNKVRWTTSAGWTIAQTYCQM